ncbi:MAG: putative toxin-antitoxin system toxin component, PIN family [Rubrivivax sp.]|jgi:putative PIN family toxin of toxin-antitoxin system|nr:putative toxin-antitoxin system toxin component, PIN family [Rubrivivax sp.]
MRPEGLARVVIDTNVWISAFLVRSGTAAQAVRRLLELRRPCFSEATFTELESRLWKPKFDRYLNLEDRRALLHDVQALAHWVEVPREVAAQAWCGDAGDDKFIHTALAARVPWLVTGDLDLLSVQPLQGLQILTPADALAEMNAG